MSMVEGLAPPVQRVAGHGLGEADDGLELDELGGDVEGTTAIDLLL